MLKWRCVLLRVDYTNKPFGLGVTKHKSTFTRGDISTAVARHLINRNLYLSRL